MIVFAVTSIALSLEHLGTKLLELTAQSLIGSPGTLFLADLNLEEIKYVPGAHNVVPDFLSRPWDGTSNEAPAAIHVLAACTSHCMRKTAAESLICVAHTEGASLWRAEFGGDHMPYSLNNT